MKVQQIIEGKWMDKYHAMGHRASKRSISASVYLIWRYDLTGYGKQLANEVYEAGQLDNHDVTNLNHPSWGSSLQAAYLGLIAFAQDIKEDGKDPIRRVYLYNAGESAMPRINKELRKVPNDVQPLKWFSNMISLLLSTDDAQVKRALDILLNPNFFDAVVPEGKAPKVTRQIATLHKSYDSPDTIRRGMKQKERQDTEDQGGHNMVDF